MSNNKKILLVEDNPDDEALTLEALNSQHLVSEIVVVRDGQQALDYLFGQAEFQTRNIQDEPQLILLDLHLPKIDGLEVLKRIRANARTRRLPVVVLTTSTLESDMIKSYDNGANSYLCKPVDFDEFIESIQKLEVYWLLINKVPSDE